MENVKENIGRNLKKMRRSAGYNNADDFVKVFNDVMQLTGTEEKLKISTYRKYEQAVNEPHPSTLALFARFYNCSMNSISGVPDASDEAHKAAAYTKLDVNTIKCIAALTGSWRSIFDKLFYDISGRGSLFRILDSLSYAKDLAEKRNEIIKELNAAASDYRTVKTFRDNPPDELKIMDRKKLPKEINKATATIDHFERELAVNEYYIEKAKKQAREAFEDFINLSLPAINDYKDLNPTTQELLLFGDIPEKTYNEARESDLPDTV